MQEHNTDKEQTDTGNVNSCGEQLKKLLTATAREVFSGICNSLLVAGVDSARPKTILVAGPGGQEGATTVGLGLAIVASEKGIGQVLLIEGNCHNPQLASILGVGNKGGLGMLLSGTGDPEALIGATSIPNLSLMGLGALPADYIRLLEPFRLRTLLEKLTADYPFIIVDGPPVHRYTESLLYATQVDRVLLVARAGVTRGPVAASAVARLSAAGCERVEILLNRRVFVIPQTVYRRL